jgi:hypothetical protein
VTKLTLAGRAAAHRKWVPCGRAMRGGNLDQFDFQITALKAAAAGLIAPGCSSVKQGPTVIPRPRAWSLPRADAAVDRTARSMSPAWPPGNTKRTMVRDTIATSRLSPLVRRGALVTSGPSAHTGRGAAVAGLSHRLRLTFTRAHLGSFGMDVGSFDRPERPAAAKDEKAVMRRRQRHLSDLHDQQLSHRLGTAIARALLITECGRHCCGPQGRGYGAGSQRDRHAADRLSTGPCTGIWGLLNPHLATVPIKSVLIVVVRQSLRSDPLRAC